MQKPGLGPRLSIYLPMFFIIEAALGLKPVVYLHAGFHHYPVDHIRQLDGHASLETEFLRGKGD
ncbi:hypothetical protein J6TS7_37240 [Paenibacillus dendritiformis]|nr:hypothetical protein J6TS7_37240 [Paenibacillus dendritiformis]